MPVCLARSWPLVLCRSIWQRLRDDDRGQTTVETAFGIATLVSVLLLAVSAMVAVANYLAVTDAAGGIARAEARGDERASAKLRAEIGGEVLVQRDSGMVTVTVSKRTAFVPISGSATAMEEGG